MRENNVTNYCCVISTSAYNHYSLKGSKGRIWNEMEAPLSNTVYNANWCVEGPSVKVNFALAKPCQTHCTPCGQRLSFDTESRQTE